MIPNLQLWFKVFIILFYNDYFFLLIIIIILNFYLKKIVGCLFLSIFTFYRNKILVSIENTKIVKLIYFDQKFKKIFKIL